MPGANTLSFTDAAWDSEVLQSEAPVLVDFWAPGCAPCRQMSPVLDQLADDYQGRVRVGKMNVAENGQTAIRYQVRAVPTILMFKCGQVVGSKVGAAGKAELQKMIDTA